jgi:hypothetical protein
MLNPSLKPSLLLRWALPRALFLASAVMVLLFGALVGPSAAQRQAGVDGTPCSDATPAAATPRAELAATPSVTAAATLCAVPRPGTPTSAGDLTVTLGADDFTAGPRVLILDVVDVEQRPVRGASVMVRTRSLEMDHGVSVYEAVETRPGHYQAERTSLGMGGDWFVEVTIERSGHAPVVLAFVLTLEGPTH